MYLLFNLIPSLASVLSGDELVLFFKLLFQFWYFALSRKFLFGKRMMRFDLHFKNKSFTLYLEAVIDLAALKEIFLLEEYNWIPMEDPKIILDLGAHYGDTTLYYHVLFPDAHIYAVEPAPDTFERLSKNVQGIANITPVHAGIADRDGQADLNLTKSSLGNSLKKRDTTERTVSVPVHTLRSLMEKYGIPKADIIKFDIEGSEEYLFASGKPQEFSRAYIGEVHADLIKDVDAFLDNFKDFKVERQPLSNAERSIIKALKVGI